MGKSARSSTPPNAKRSVDGEGNATHHCQTRREHLARPVEPPRKLAFPPSAVMKLRGGDGEQAVDSVTEAHVELQRWHGLFC
jgi:hypothetical protein